MTLRRGGLGLLVQKEETCQLQTRRLGGGTYDVVAITACPTGIAHTFMAAKGLEDQAAKMGVSIKVETQGSGGAKMY